MLAPGRPEAPFQYIDARDLAQLSLKLIEGGHAGTFHATAPAITWADLIHELIDTLAARGATVAWVASDWLVEQGVPPRDLPLWTGSDEPEHVFTLDPARALAAGLTPRPLSETIADTATWLRDPAIVDPPARLGLSPEREVLLLQRWH